MSKELSSSKETIIKYIKNSLELIKLENYENDGAIKGTPTSNALCWSLEAILLHSLNNSKQNFWPLLKQILHKTTLKQLSTFSQINSDVGKSRAWIRTSLNDCSLDSYLNCVVNDNQLLKKFYHHTAFLLDRHCTNELLEISKELATLHFDLPCNASTLNRWNHSPLQLSTHSSSDTLKWPTLVTMPNSDQGSSHSSQTISFTLRPQNAMPSLQQPLSSNPATQPSPPNHKTTNSTPSKAPNTNKTTTTQHPTTTSLSSPPSNLTSPRLISGGSSTQQMSKGVELTNEEFGVLKMLTSDSDSGSLVSRPDFKDGRRHLYERVYGVAGGVEENGMGGWVSGRNMNGGVVEGDGKGGVKGGVKYEVLQQPTDNQKQQNQSQQQLGNNDLQNTIKYRPLQQNITRPQHIKPPIQTPPPSPQLKPQLHSLQLHTQQLYSPQLHTQPLYSPQLHTQQHKLLQQLSQSPGQQVRGNNFFSSPSFSNSFSDGGMDGRMGRGMNGRVDGRKEEEINEIKERRKNRLIDSISLSDDLKFKLIVKDNLDRFPFTINHHNQQLPNQQLHNQQQPNLQQKPSNQHQQLPNQQQLPNLQQKLPTLQQQLSQQQQQSNQKQLQQQQPHQQFQQQQLFQQQPFVSESAKAQVPCSDNDVKDDSEHDDYESFSDLLKSYNKKDSHRTDNTTTNTYITSPPNTAPDTIVSDSNTSITQATHTNTNPYLNNTATTFTNKESNVTSTNTYYKSAEINTATTNVTTTNADDTGSCCSINRSKSVNDIIEALNLKQQKLNEDKTNSSIETYTRIPSQQGLSAQSFRCLVCSAPIGVSFSKERVCSYSRAYHCGDCMGSLHEYLPYKVVFNWDFNTYNVSNDNHKLLQSLKSNALINVDTLNPSLYQHVIPLHDIKVLRKRLRCLKAYLCTCQAHLMKQYLQLLDKKAYLYDNIDLYSLEDLLKVPSGQLVKSLTMAINYAANHVYSCVLCSQRGFYCEICRQDKIIYPFDHADTVRCGQCRSLFHRSCKTETVECPKCRRLQNRNQSQPSIASTNLKEELLNSESSLDAQINYSFSSLKNDNCEDEGEDSCFADQNNSATKSTFPLTS